MSKNSIRNDWQLIESLINPKSKVLDIGCGEGGLIKQLEANIHSDTRGIETVSYTHLTLPTICSV